MESCEVMQLYFLFYFFLDILTWVANCFHKMIATLNVWLLITLILLKLRKFNLGVDQHLAVRIFAHRNEFVFLFFVFLSQTGVFYWADGICSQCLGGWRRTVGCAGSQQLTLPASLAPAWLPWNPRAHLSSCQVESHFLLLSVWCACCRPYFYG